MTARRLIALAFIALWTITLTGQPAPLAPIIAWEASADLTVEGYTVAWGAVSRVYTQTADVPATAVQYGPVTSLDATKPWYFAIRSWRTDASGTGRVMSPWTDEVCVAPTGVTCTAATTQQPYAPGKPVLLALPLTPTPPVPPDPAAPKLPSIAWTLQTLSGTVPHFVAQQHPIFDALSGKVLAYLSRGTASGIYSTDYFAIAGDGASTRIGGTGSTLSNDCATYPNSSTTGGWNNGSGSDVQPWPSDGHPDFDNAIDTSRNQLYQFSRLACNNTALDTWRMQLNVDPTLNRWTKLTPPTNANISYGGSMTYHAAHDVMVLHGRQWGGIGFPQTWYFFPDPEHDGCSAVQTAAGCVTPENWLRVYDAQVMTPPLSYQNNLFDDPATGKVLSFGVFNEAAPFTTQVWSFDPVAHTWTDRNPANAPTNLRTTSNNEVLVARITTTGRFVYHRTSHAGAPGDASQIADFLYDSVANTFTLLTTTGTGPDALTFMTYHPLVGPQGALIAMRGFVGQTPILWKGAIQ